MYCHESAAGEPFILPCKCKLVHRKCLDEWRAKTLNDRDSNRCEICLAEYNIKRSCLKTCLMCAFEIGTWACVIFALYESVRTHRDFDLKLDAFRGLVRWGKRKIDTTMGMDAVDDLGKLDRVV